jgi:molybdopterin/thiamine biosynthesis adenylyltransferase
MLLILLLLAGLLGLARLFRVPLRVQVAVVAVILAEVLLVQVALPPGHPLREATGGSLKAWLAVLALAALVAGYALVLARLRARARPVPAPLAPAPQRGSFSGPELERYARHIVLREIGGPGQQRLKAARVLLVGAGGLGSPAALYLAAAGVGTLGLIDDDSVSLSNLQRQILHSGERIGMPKVVSAQVALAALNPHVVLRPYNRRLTEADAAALFAEYDLILDGTDNFATRHLVNRAAVATGRPLLAGAIAQWEGQISLYDPARGAPCFACVFPEIPAAGLAPACAEAGVVGALPGVVGAMMAVEAIKEIAGAGQSLRGTLLIYDALWSENRRIAIARRPGCAICGGAHSA